MASQMCLKNLTPVGIIAGVSSGVQGVVGSVLSICVICTYFCALGSYPSGSSSSPTFAQYLTYLFQGDRCSGSFKTLGFTSDSKSSPLTLVIWMFLSLFFNLILHVVSVCLVLGPIALENSDYRAKKYTLKPWAPSCQSFVGTLSYAIIVSVSSLILLSSESVNIFSLALWKWKKEKTVYVVNTWTFFSILTCVDDMLLTYVFGDLYFGYTGSTPPLQSLTSLIVVFFSTRGVFCWLANLCFIVFMVNASTDLMRVVKRAKKQESSQLELIRSWPTLNTIPNRQSSIDRDELSLTLPPGVSNAFTERPAYVRTPSMYGSQFPEYSALARWPSLAFNVNSQTVKERSNRSLMRPAVEQQRTSRSLREYAMSNNNLPPSLPLQYVRKNRSSPDGNENQGFEGSQELRDRFIRLQSDSGSEPYDPEIPPYPQEVYSSQPSLQNKSDTFDDYEFVIKSIPIERKFETNTMRPKSLHEAILTRPPLKPVQSRQRKNSSSNV